MFSGFLPSLFCVRFLIVYVYFLYTLGCLFYNTYTIAHFTYQKFFFLIPSKASVSSLPELDGGRC